MTNQEQSKQAASLTFPVGDMAINWSEALNVTLDKLGVTQEEYLKKLAPVENYPYINAVRAAMNGSYVSEAKFRKAMRLLGCEVELKVSIAKPTE
jgi:hypothetical protein